MKRTAWLAAPMLALLLTVEAAAQFFPPPIVPVYPPLNPVNSGLFFQYRTGRLTLQGYTTTGLPPNSILVTQPGYGYVPGVPVLPFYPVAPYGIIDSRVSYNFISPRVTVIAPSAADYDLRGVDLDVNGPAALNPRIGAQPQMARRPDPAPVRPVEKPAPAPAVAAAPAPAPAPAKEFELPGKDVSIPRKAIRPPADEPAPARPLPPLPGPKDAPLDPPAQVEQHIALGKAAFQAGEYGLAAQRFRRASQIDPHQARSYHYLAQAYFAMARYPEAVDAVVDAMGVQRNYPSAAYQPRTDLYPGREDEFEKHLKLLEGAQAREPASYTLLFFLAHQRWFDGQRDLAVDQFRRARNLTIDPMRVDRFLTAAAPAKVVAK